MLADGGQLDGKRLLSPRAVELYASNHVGELFVGQAGRPRGMGFGLTVEVVVDPVQAGTFRSQGSFGWSGAYNTHFFIDLKEKIIGIFMTQVTFLETRGQLRDDFENAVMQAVVGN